jgi:hypothetical protein
MNYKQTIERFIQIMRDYPAGSRKHELAKYAFAEYVRKANELATGGR